MNVKSAIFSGIMTSLIVAMIALAVNHISGREHRRTVVVTGGAILGFVIGIAFQGIKDQKDAVYEDEES
jgi:ABC-type sugar transport system permease subunit